VTRAEIEKLSDPEVQKYLVTNAGEDESRLLLKHREMFGLPFRLIAHQLAVRKKGQAKLPMFCTTPGIVFPPSVNFEQCSSEATANFKTDLLSQNLAGEKNHAADLTGGLGIDSYFMSTLFRRIEYVEPDTQLLHIALHNHTILGASSIQHHGQTAEDFLANRTDRFDLFYLDPSRRDTGNKKLLRLADCTPNVVGLLPRLLESGDFVLIKASPLLDIHQALRELQCVFKVMVVSVSNECKELLFLLKRNFSGEPMIETYNLSKTGEVIQSFSFLLRDETQAVSDFGEPQTYLYEPNASLLKSGAFRLVGERFCLKKIHVNTHLYTSSEKVENFPGRVFRVDDWKFDSKNIPDQKANVLTRNYPIDAEALRKKLKLADGGEKYVIGFSGWKQKYTVLATRLA
jgi:16S rRNA G966 N2-methylase RsmD